MKDSVVNKDGMWMGSTKLDAMQPSRTTDTGRQKIAVRFSKLLRDITILTLENGMFQRYIDRVGLSNFVFSARSSGTSVSSSVRAMSKMLCHWSEAPAFGAAGKVVRLSAERKCHIAKEEQLEFRKQFSCLREKSEALIDETQASLKRLHLLHDDISRQRKAFDKNVTVLVDDFAQRQMAVRAFVWFHQCYMKRMGLSPLLSKLSEALFVVFIRLVLHDPFANLTLTNSTGAHLLARAWCKLKRVVDASAEVSDRVNRRVRTSDKLSARMDDYQDDMRLDELQIRRLKNRMACFNVPKLDDLIVSMKENQKVHRQLATENRKMRLAKKLHLQQHAKLWRRIKERHSP
ncbi:hypothetical protein CRM22_005206 [Opisthorchis felineus]|uniref:Uncharacterized protein n=1 Tax=Opisthorchis felineus TaxID=147828 RepID=A0A4S2LS82_OPIFE|nr:hypothetical protein CRM22_005206 [Opisthorchis felineus]